MFVKQNAILQKKEGKNVKTPVKSSCYNGVSKSSSTTVNRRLDVDEN